MVTNTPESLAPDPLVRAPVIGTGKSGCSTLRMLNRRGIQGAQFITFDTDAEIASGSVHEELINAHLVVITTSVTDITSGQAATASARLFRERGVLTMAVLTNPSRFEKARPGADAEWRIAALLSCSDLVVVVPACGLPQRVGNEEWDVLTGMPSIDEKVYRCIQGLVELLTVPGPICVGFEDVKLLLSTSPGSLGATCHGRGAGSNKVEKAGEQALANPRLKWLVEHARSLIVSVRGASELQLGEVTRAAGVFHRAMRADSHMVFGMLHDPPVRGEAIVTMIAVGTGFLT